LKTTNSKIASGIESGNGSSGNGKQTSTTRPVKKPLFGTDIGVDPRTGKQFELTGSGLFIPLPGEFESRSQPEPMEKQVGVAEQGLFVPRSTQVHFQKDFSKKVKMDPLFGVRIKTNETSINAARAVFTGDRSRGKKT